MTLKPTHRGGPAAESKQANPPAWLPWLLWGIAVAVVALAVFLIVRRPAFAASDLNGITNLNPANQQDILSIPADSGKIAALPEFATGTPESVSRSALPHTTIPDRPPATGQTYTVEEGDSVFGLAEKFKLKQPETVLWANFNVLKDNPDLLSIGQVLNIPPTDGVFYKWQKGDTLESVASQFKATTQAILLWPGNNLDLVDPKIDPGTMIMIPGGKREFVRAWVIPTIPRGAAGVVTKIPGTCNTGAGGAYGTGTFMWPTSSHIISGNNYWSGHLAIDIGAVLGSAVAAADSGVVVFSGWNSNGYGNMIMIDHGNGFQSLYAHLNARFAVCGQSVLKGATIGAAGSTGNSTGPHLHFEIRLMGGFVNPLGYLP